MKKLLCVILSLALMCALLPGALADGGTVVSDMDGLYAALWEQAQAIGRAVGEETGCTVTMTCSSGYPPVTNDAALLAEVRERFPIAEAETTCITEDFSEYQRHAPGVFFFLGTGGIELHAPTFTFPEEILDKGEALLCGLV